MNLHIENINLTSNSGPNSFANKLIKYITKSSVEVDFTKKPDAHLCFIESNKIEFKKPMFLRLDGIYFNVDFDYRSQNSNIKRTYELADGVIFQSEFNKQLTFKYFGNHNNYTIIQNGADYEMINQAPELKFDRYENLWCCASSCGCQIICSSAGGTKEIAGSNAIVIEEAPWDYTPVRLYSPPIMDFNKKINTGRDNELKMNKVSEKYKNFIFGEKNA